MLTPQWNDTEFVKAKEDDPLLSKLSAATASFLVNNGLPQKAHGFTFNLDSSLRTLQSALLENGGPEHVQERVERRYLKRPAPSNLIAIGRYGPYPEMGFARYVCIDTNMNDAVVLFKHLDYSRREMQINSSITRFFALLSILKSMYTHKEYSSADEGKSYVRHYIEISQSMRTAMIAAEAPGFDFNKSLWDDILKSVRRGGY